MKNKRARARRNVADTAREFPVRSEDQHRYASVTRMLGDGRLLAKCDDGVERMCRVRGKLRGREWINANDVLLVSVRDFEPDKADVLWKYQPNEVDRLRRWGEPVCAFGPPSKDDEAVAGEEEFEEAAVVFEDI
jgi:translation initiation factor 1A